ncbi:MAG: undecaprenyl-phosphate glucose phosphotransferase [Myxococcaceae bacterium]|nr:undecaprenyl-phosphate glucose phosphotransferase [Myxococcaceae bacterium]
MFSRFQRFYNSIKLLADLAAIGVAFVLAYATRFWSGLPHESIPPLDDTLTFVAFALVLIPVTYRQANLYTTARARTHLGEVFEVFKATLFASLLLVSVTYFTRERYSRATIVIFVGYTFGLVSVVRVLFRSFMHALRRRGHNLKSVLVVGAGELGQRVIATIEAHRELGFRVVGLLTRHPDKVGTTVMKVPVVGLWSQLGATLDQQSVDQVVIALPLEEQAAVRPLMDELAQRTVDVKVVPDLFQYMTLRGGFEEFGGLPIINLQGGPLDGWNRVLKRVFDVAISLTALVLLSPLMLLLAALVKITSKGPVFYRQERMGMDGQTFEMLKLRTMRVDAEAQGAQMASKGDPRTTPLGALMRKTSLDELPQLFNVLKGDMSLVGPRPERPVFIREFRQKIPRYHLRHLVKSGMTGWAQVNGLRGQTSIEKRIELDLYYIENWSLLLDLKILLRTAFGGFLSRNAY